MAMKRSREADAELVWVWKDKKFRVRCSCDNIVDGEADPKKHWVACGYCKEWIVFKNVSYCKPLADGIHLIRNFRNFYEKKSMRWMLECRWMLQCKCKKAFDLRKVYCAELCPECDADFWPRDLNEPPAYKRCH